MAKPSKKRPAPDAEKPPSSPRKPKESSIPWSFRLRRFRREIGVAFGLVVLTLLVFGQVVGFDFINIDDNQYVFENGHVMAGLTLETVKWAFTTIETANYWHPVTWLSHALDWQMHGSNAGGHHLTNLVLHTVNTVSLFAALRWITGSTWRSGLVAALFAVHPLHVEPVVWVSSRKDMLLGLFWIATLGAYAWHVERPESRKRYGLVLAGCVLALTVKITAVFLPFTLLLLDLWPFNRFRSDSSDGSTFDLDPKRIWPLLREKIPLFVPAIAVFLGNSLVPKTRVNSPIYIVVSFADRMYGGLLSYVTYLERTVWPDRLMIYYEPFTNIPPWKGIACGLLLAALTVGAAASMKRHGYLIVGWLWFLAVLVPFVGFLPLNTPMADRYVYIPHVGLFIAVVWGMHDLLKNRFPNLQKPVAGVAVAVLVVSAVVSAVLASYWKNPIMYFERAVKVHPNSFFSHSNLGQLFVTHLRFAEGERELRETLRLRPDYVPALQGMGIVATNRGSNAEAISYLTRAVQLAPRIADSQFYLGNMYVTEKRYDEALQYLTEALRLNPGHALAHGSMGNVYYARKEYDQAFFHFQEAVRLKPNFVEAHINYATALNIKGRTPEAVVQLQEALRYDPNSAPATRNLGNIYFNQGRWEDAINTYTRAITLDQTSADAYYKIGVAYSSVGKRGEAVSNLTRALQLNPNLQAAREALAKAQSAGSG